ncbi:MAG: thymidine phosphorylase [Candidatus Neomarinimicrobiota bacterium]
MIPAELIKKKRNNQKLEKDELSEFISGYVKGTVPEYQMAAMLMAIYFNSMDPDEIDSLVTVMLESGERMNFSQMDRYVADKHSTGGVGDKVSIILGPLLAAAGLAIPMITGRSLGHTGGTLDKLETIPGLKTNLDLSEFKRQVQDVGIAMISQTDEICPADRMMYALRDVTGTVESIPLICGSIMSKKIAEGIQGLVSDVKTGNGAFMKTKERARKLGAALQRIGESFQITTDIVYSSMDQPLGRYAGLWCEIQESVAGLHGKGPEDTMTITYELGSRLLMQAKLAKSRAAAVTLQKNLIQSGAAYEIFLEMVQAQGGDPKVFDKNQEHHKARFEQIILASSSGIIQKMDTYRIGLATVELGCGRKKASDLIDPTAGIEFYHKIGAEVSKGDTIIRYFNSHESRLTAASRLLMNTFKIGDEAVEHELIFQ